jgi:hypothetical protein
MPDCKTVLLFVSNAAVLNSFSQDGARSMKEFPTVLIGEDVFASDAMNTALDTATAALTSPMTTPYQCDILTTGSGTEGARGSVSCMS